MKREELEKLGLSKEQMDAVMAANGTDVEAVKKTATQKDEQIAALTTERDGLKTQVADRDKDITELKKSSGDNESLSKQFADLQAKYDGDTKTLQEKLERQRYDYAAEQMFVSAPFASKLAKKAAIAEFKAKGYKLTEDGTGFVGADGYLDQLKKDDPVAFIADKQDDDPKEPTFAKPLSGGDKDKSTANGFFSGGGLAFVRTPTDGK